MSKRKTAPVYRCERARICPDRALQLFLFSPKLCEAVVTDRRSATPLSRAQRFATNTRRRAIQTR